MKMKLQSVELKESKKGFPYVVAQFTETNGNFLEIAYSQVVTLNFTAPYNVCTDEERKDEATRNAKYKEFLENNWLSTKVKEVTFDIGGWDIEVEPYLRLDSEGKIVRNANGEKDIRTKIRIYGFCTYADDGTEVPRLGMETIKQQAINRLANSTRLRTVAKHNEEVAKRKAIKEAAEKSLEQRLTSSPIIDDLDD